MVVFGSFKDMSRESVNSFQNKLNFLVSRQYQRNGQHFGFSDKYRPYAAIDRDMLRECAGAGLEP